MQDLVKEQFRGFLETPQLRARKEITAYPPYFVKPLSEEELQLHPHPSQRVLGKRMEEFFLHYVQQHSEEEVLAYNEQVIHEKETLGEIDFLLKNKNSGQILHVELVYKFYLFDPSSGMTQTEKWIGPNRRDSLPRKLHRLEQRQFPLLFRKEAAPLLERLGVSSEDIEQKLCFKASFFLPDGLPQEKYPGVDPQAISGYYIKLRDFSFERFGRSLFFSPVKPDWPVVPEYNKIWVSFDEINKLILPMLTRRQTPLLWRKTPDEKYERFFITWW